MPPRPRQSGRCFFASLVATPEKQLTSRRRIIVAKNPRRRESLLKVQTCFLMNLKIPLYCLSRTVWAKLVIPVGVPSAWRNTSLTPSLSLMWTGAWQIWIGPVRIGDFLPDATRALCLQRPRAVLSTSASSRMRLCFWTQSSKLRSKKMVLIATTRNASTSCPRDGCANHTDLCCAFSNSRRGNTSIRPAAMLSNHGRQLFVVLVVFFACALHRVVRLRQAYVKSEILIFSFGWCKCQLRSNFAAKLMVMKFTIFRKNNEICEIEELKH